MVQVLLEDKAANQAWLDEHLDSIRFHPEKSGLKEKAGRARSEETFLVQVVKSAKHETPQLEAPRNNQTYIRGFDPLTGDACEMYLYGEYSSKVQRYMTQNCILAVRGAKVYTSHYEDLRANIRVCTEPTIADPEQEPVTPILTVIPPDNLGHKKLLEAVQKLRRANKNSTRSEEEASESSQDPISSPADDGERETSFQASTPIIPAAESSGRRTRSPSKKRPSQRNESEQRQSPTLRRGALAIQNQSTTQNGQQSSVQQEESGNSVPAQPTRKTYIQLKDCTRVNTHRYNTWGVIISVNKQPSLTNGPRKRYMAQCYIRDNDERNTSAEDYQFSMLADDRTHFPDNLEIGDVLRIHGMVMQKYNGKMTGRVYDARSVVVFRGMHGDPISPLFTCSREKLNFTLEDRKRVEELRQWDFFYNPSQSLKERRFEEVNGELPFIAMAKVLYISKTILDGTIITVTDGTRSPVLLLSAKYAKDEDGNVVRNTKEFEVTAYRRRNIDIFVQGHEDLIDSLQINDFVVMDGVLCHEDELCNRKKELLAKIFRMSVPARRKLEIRKLSPADESYALLEKRLEEKDSQNSKPACSEDCLVAKVLDKARRNTESMAQDMSILGSTPIDENGGGADSEPQADPESSENDASENVYGPAREPSIDLNTAASSNSLVMCPDCGENLGENSSCCEK